VEFWVDTINSARALRRPLEFTEEILQDDFDFACEVMKMTLSKPAKPHQQKKIVWPRCPAVVCVGRA
jgi:hypothetical protein